MKTSLDHLPDAKRRELARIVEILFAEFEDALKGRNAPHRNQLTVLPGDPDRANRWAHRRWLLVATWDEAGADVSFADALPTFSREYFDEVRRGLQGFNRASRHVRATRGGGRIFLDGGLSVGSVATESPAMRTACEDIGRDVLQLFEGLPRDEVPDSASR